MDILEKIKLAALHEGVNDPGIFKAVFLAGGPGSGKSFIVGKTALTSFGLKLINSDDAFEHQLKKVGLTTSPEDIYSDLGQSVRGKAKALTKARQNIALKGRLGLVVDGTGKDYDKIASQAKELKKIGYEVAMIFVNTDLETAQARNKARTRTLPEKEVADMWNAVQKNIGKFQNFFGQNFIVVDNSTGANYEGAVNSAYKKIGAWTKKPANTSQAKKWIKSQKAERGMKEELNLDEAFEAVLDEAVNESKYGTQAQRLMSPLQKARQDKEKRDRDRDGKLKSTALPMRKKKNEEVELDEAPMPKWNAKVGKKTYTVPARNPAEANRKANALAKKEKNFGVPVGLIKKVEEQIQEAVATGKQKTALKRLMRQALGGKAPKAGYTSSIAPNGDFVVYDGGMRIQGRIKKGDFNDPMKGEGYAKI